MITKSIESIVVDDFQSLIDNEVAESKTIEYKQTLNIKTDSDKKEFLADVSSFANASGGHLIFGISEEKGIPKSIEGFEIENLNQLLLQVESLLRDGLSPRIGGFTIKEFLKEGIKYILLIQILKSWTGPHQVILKGHDKFYSRGSNGKYKLDIEELRSAFAFTENNTIRIQNFITGRISNIISNETPVPLDNYGKIAIHLVPFSSFAPGKKYDIADESLGIKKLRALDGSSTTPRFNLDGIFSASMAPGRGKSYVQFFRNGIIETVNSELLEPFNGELKIPAAKGHNYEALIVEIIEEYFELYTKIRIDLPIFLFLSLIKIRGYYIASDLVRYWAGKPVKISTEIITMPEIVVNSLEDNIPILLKPLFDTIWNACGFERSYNYDDKGDWKNNR